MAELRRALGLGHATAMVVGIIIGASIFVQPSEITRHVPSVTGIVLVWIAAGVLTLFGALVAAELASAFPQTGGVYVFLREAYSPAAGFLWGWAMLWTMHTGIVAAIATVFGRYAGHFVELGDAGVRAVAVGAIVVLTAINYVGVKHGGTLQAAFTIAKVAAVAGLIVAGALWRGSPVAGASLSVSSEAVLTLEGFVLAMAAGLFAYGGWHMVTYAAGETRDAARTIPRALVAGTLIVTICYAGLNAVYLHVLPLDAVRSSTRIATDAAGVMLGSSGAGLVAALVMISAFSAVNGVILAGPRVYYSMARDGTAPAWLGAVHARFGTPHRALVVQGVLAVVLAATNSYGALVSRVIYTEWIFFAAMAAGLMILRRRASYQPAYRVWGYPFVPIAFIVVSLGVVVLQVRAVPWDSLIGLGMVVVGLPVYYIWKQSRHEGSSKE